jgi:hypothetical protein
MKNTKFKNITKEKLVTAGIYDDINYDQLLAGLENGSLTTKEVIKDKLDNVNKYLKEHFIKQRLSEIAAAAKNPDPVIDEVITDYLRIEFNETTIIAYRYGQRRPESIDKKLQGWQFEGFTTFGQLDSFADSFAAFKQEFNKYETTTNYFLDLNIIGGIVENQCLISFENMQSWSDQENVNFEPWGFDNKGKMICFSDMLLKSFAQLETKATKIKMKGKPETLTEARTLKQADEGKMYLNILFNGMLDLSLLGGQKND